MGVCQKLLLLRDWLDIGRLVVSDCVFITCFNLFCSVGFCLFFSFYLLNCLYLFFSLLPFRFLPHPGGRSERVPAWCLPACLLGLTHNMALSLFPELQAFAHHGRPLPRYQVALCFGEEFPDPQRQRKLITAHVSRTSALPKRNVFLGEYDSLSQTFLPCVSCEEGNKFLQMQQLTTSQFLADLGIQPWSSAEQTT